jgi:hypothetical protein
MSRIRSGVSATILVTAIFLLGCSGASNPVSNGPLQSSDRPGQETRSGHVLWGLWHVTIDPDTLTAEAAPLRTAEFTCNVTQFMQPPASHVNMISFAFPPGSDPANGYFVVDVSLKHPFPGLNVYNGFDVRGVFMANGTLTGSHDSSVLRAGFDDSTLQNADGYTRFWNSTEFTSFGTVFGFTTGKLAPPIKPTATINAYKYFADGLDKEAAVESLDHAGRGMFTAGSTNTRQYKIQFRMTGGKPAFDFNYAVDASWEQPDPSYAPDYPKEAFPLSANCAEAYHLHVTDAGSDAYYVDGIYMGGHFKFDLEVFDHQGAVNPGGVPAEISAIWLESDVLPSPVDVLGTAVVKPGTTIASSVFEVELSSLDLTQSGPVEFLATIESSDPTTYEPQVDGGSAFQYPSAPLAAYFTFTGTVLDAIPSTLVVLSPNGGESWDVGSAQTITWNPGSVPGTVFIDYSKDNFVADIHSIATGEINDGSYSWPSVPDDPSTTAKVRVSSTVNPAINDRSDDYFTIVGSGWPTTPVLIDPDHQVYATRFAVDLNGTVHALYCDYGTIYWSYSTDKGNHWTNMGQVGTSTAGMTISSSLNFNPNLQMDAAGNYVYAVFVENGANCNVRGMRLDATNLGAGWSAPATIWSIPGLYFFYGLQISALADGNVMVVGGKYTPFSEYYSYGQWTTLVAGIPNPPNIYTTTDNGSITYEYMRYTPCMVHDTNGDFYISLGGFFFDNNNANGTGADYGNSLFRYNKGSNNWHMLQTEAGNPTPAYWVNETQAVAIDSNNQMYWVGVYENQGGGDCGGAGRWAYGDWKMFYGYGPTTGDHTGWAFTDPIDEPNYHITIPVSPPGCVFNSIWWNASIGSADGSSVVMIYQKARYVAEMWATRRTGSTWSAPVNVEGPTLYADLPWGKMHPSGNFLITFTDFQTDGSLTVGSRLPYFVTWK